MLYQEGPLSGLRSADDLNRRHAEGGGPLMFGATKSSISGIRPAERFEMKMHDRVLGRTLGHGYDIAALPVIT